jgi:response regulator RpfG family c-di-GMP phosphodiesterase
MALFTQQMMDRLDADGAQNPIRHTVMVVDDKDANLSVMAAILRPFYHLLEARDGEEALSLVEELDKERPLACVVSDHRMPRRNGVELLERIQQLRPRTTRIIVTGYIDVDTIIDSINKAGIYKFVVKPFDPHDFLLTVRRAVELHELQVQVAAGNDDLREKIQQQTKELEESTAKLLAANQALLDRNAEFEEINKQLSRVRTQSGEGK